MVFSCDDFWMISFFLFDSYSVLLLNALEIELEMQN